MMMGLHQLSMARSTNGPGDNADRPKGARTQFVEAAFEPIPQPFPTVKNLPRTLSIDAMTSAEIQGVQQQIFEEVRSKKAERLEGIDGCMQWLFVRHSTHQQWQAFGFNFRGLGIAKVNGGLRRTKFDYSISAEPVKSIFGTLYGPSKKLGGGGMWMHSFEEKSSFRQLHSTADSDDALVTRLNLGAFGPEARYLTFGRTSALRVEKSSTVCTLLQARCRQYTFQINQPAEWVGSITRDASSGSADHTREAIDMASGLKLEIAIEDMCPFSREAMVEEPVNSRAGGAEPGVRKYGLGSNAALREALKPFVQEFKR